MKKTLIFLSAVIIANNVLGQKSINLNLSIKYDQVKAQKQGTIKLDNDEVITIGIEASKQINSGNSIIAKLNFPLGTRSAVYNYFTQERWGPFNSLINTNNYMHIDVNFMADFGLFYDFLIWEAKNCCCDNDQNKKANNNVSLSIGGGASFYKSKNEVGITSSKSNFVPFKQTLGDSYFKSHNMNFDIGEVNYNVGSYINYNIKSKKTGKTKITLSYGLQRYFDNYFKAVNTVTGKKTGFAETNTLTVSSFGIKVPIIK
jgi:hypothetical protein